MEQIKEAIEALCHDELKDRPDYYRCHEVARKICSRLKKEGFLATAKDGLVEYDSASLAREGMSLLFDENELSSMEPECLKELEGVMESCDGKFLKSVHSWCEVFYQDNIIMVDFQNHLPDVEMGNYLIVKEKNRLPHTYHDCGKILWRFIFFFAPPGQAAFLPLYVIFLRR